MDEREQALSMKKAKIEQEHADLLWKRNALCVLAPGLPASLFAAAFQLNYITNSNSLLFVLALFVIALVVCFFIAGYNHQLATKQKELGELADEILKDTDEKEQLIVLLEKTVQKVKLKEQTEEIRHRLMLLQEILGKLKSPYKKEQDHGVEMARLFRNQMYE